MQAAWYERKGGASEVLQVGEVPEPRPGAGEVRVRVQASGVNPSDVKNRSGYRGNVTMAFPRIIPHQDGAGVIDAAGEGVPSSRVGERVWIYEAQWQRPFGTAAEYCVVPSANAVPLPANTSFAEGACLGVPAMTAHRCVFADGPVEGQTVLVTGGAGCVGNYAVQLARWGGATVLATVSSPAKAAVAEAAGAHHIVNYRTEDVPARLREITGGAGVDRVVDVAFGANLPTMLNVLKGGGWIVSYGSDAVNEPALPFSGLLQKHATLRFVHVYQMSAAAHAAAVADIAACLESGLLRHVVAHHYPLSEVARAHDAVERGELTGKAIVTPA